MSAFSTIPTIVCNHGTHGFLLLTHRFSTSPLCKFDTLYKENEEKAFVSYSTNDPTNAYRVRVSDESVLLLCKVTGTAKKSNFLILLGSKIHFVRAAANNWQYQCTSCTVVQDDDDDCLSTQYNAHVYISNSRVKNLACPVCAGSESIKGCKGSFIYGRKETEKPLPDFFTNDAASISK